MLISSFKLIDIRNYETNNNISLFDYFSNLSVSVTIDLISLSLNLSTEEASDVLDNYLLNHPYLEVVQEIRECILGNKGGEEGESQDSSSSSTLDTSEFNTVTDLYIYYCMQLMSVGMSYGDFWSMNTKELFRVFNAILLKVENEANRQLNAYHTLAALVGSAVWGKLPKDVPKVEITEQGKKTREDEEIELLAVKLKAFANRHNQKIK